jgi:hypothetical protein
LSTKDVSFAAESDSPATRACVDVLLLIGRAVRSHFPDLVDACEGNPTSSPWDEVLRVLAEILFREMSAKNVTNISHAIDLWNEFARSLTVKNLPLAGRDAIRAAGTKVVNDAIAANAGIGMYILQAANTQAERWIKSRISPHMKDASFVGATLVIDFDEHGTQFCASSSPLSGEIHWTLQPFEHSLYGAMVVSRVLEHEYVSHMIPVNQFLSKGVREVFLMEMLEEEHRNDAVQIQRNNNAEIKLAAWFRWKLEQHFYRNRQANRAELRDFEKVAVGFRRKSPSNFWKMTSEILLLPDGEAEALLVDQVLKFLRPRADSIVDKLTIPWKGFPACWDRIQKREYK